MSNEQSVETTTISGYFNGNRWPIQLVISRFNCTLHLVPGEFVRDKQQRKINDPFFEAYASTKQLKREVSDVPVPIIRVPVASHTGLTVPAAQCDGQSVRVVTEWKVDAKGLRQPVIPGPVMLPPQPVNKPSVIPMTLEEARARGYIGKQRIVSEDYGMVDTAGTPPSNPPPIRISVDSNMNRGAVAPLPKELVAEALAGAPERAPLVQQLAAAAFASADVDSGGFMNAVTHHAPVQAAVPHMTQSLPEPAVDEPAVDEPPLEEAEPVPRAPRLPALAKSFARPAGVVQYTCSVCAAPFQFRSQLLTHARTTAGHQSMVEAIMAPYPAH